jgi:hypothetical protein
MAHNIGKVSIVISPNDVLFSSVLQMVWQIEYLFMHRPALQFTVIQTGIAVVCGTF